jgi:hypothetical protein
MPEVPSWNCGRCRRRWPCGTAREDLLVEYVRDRAALAVFMATQLGEAARHIQSPDPLELFDRFLGWTRPEHSPRRPIWDCEGCGRPWPCVVRQRQLWVEMPKNPVAIAEHMAGWMDVARLDLADLGAVQLEARFVGWLYGRTSDPTERSMPDGQSPDSDQLATGSTVRP